MEYSSKESGIKALRDILYVLSSGVVLCAAVPFGNPIMLPVSGKVNVFVKIGMCFAAL